MDRTPEQSVSEHAIMPLQLDWVRIRFLYRDFPGYLSSPNKGCLHAVARQIWIMTKNEWMTGVLDHDAALYTHKGYSGPEATWVTKNETI